VFKLKIDPPPSRGRRTFVDGAYRLDVRLARPFV
jgi:hypothetical protein